MSDSTIFQVTEKQGTTTFSMVLSSSVMTDGKLSMDGSADDGIKHRVVNAYDMARVKAALFVDRTSTAAVGTLNFSHCDFTDPQAFQALLELIQDDAHLCPEKLDLSATKFANKSDFATLLSTLQANTTVVDLNLSNYLCSEYVAADGSFYHLLRSNKTLQKLDLSGHSLDMEVIVDLTRGLQESSSKLTELKLHSCLLNDVSATLLLQHDSNLRVLDLSSNNHFSTLFLNTSVANLLQHSSNLEYLTLDHSSSMFASVQRNDIQPFLNALANNTTCKSLSLRYCRLQEAVGEALLKALVANTTLERLNLEFSGFALRDKGNEILIQYIPQLKTLKQLDIITLYPQASVPRLLEALKKNSSLQSFSPRFKAQACQTESQQSVQAIMERNRRLAQARTLLVNSSDKQRDAVPLSAAILPMAFSQLSQTKDGSAATFQVLQHWIAECI
ncbi:hypothetical protein ACA910_010611 [Epithemia clementina (nom. ined.)]